MKNYEIMFIVRPDVTEDVVKSTVKTLEKVLTDGKAKITLSKELGQKGYYFLYNIEANDDAAIKEFDRVARIDENVVRHLIINLDK